MQLPPDTLSWLLGLVELPTLSSRRLSCRCSGAFLVAGIGPPGEAAGLGLNFLSRLGLVWLLRRRV